MSVLRKSLCYLSEGKNENENYTVDPSPMQQDNPISCYTLLRSYVLWVKKKYKQISNYKTQDYFPFANFSIIKVHEQYQKMGRGFLEGQNRLLCINDVTQAYSRNKSFNLQFVILA